MPAPTSNRCAAVAALESWLDDVNASGLWTAAGPNGSILRGYSIKGRVVIAQVFGKGGGFELYRPASDSLSISDTLQEAALYCGADEPPAPAPPY
jgi:hypothetical protein